jgi:hypothetical protein
MLSEFIKHPEELFIQAGENSIRLFAEPGIPVFLNEKGQGIENYCNYSSCL